MTTNIGTDCRKNRVNVTISVPVETKMIPLGVVIGESDDEPRTIADLVEAAVQLFEHDPQVEDSSFGIVREALARPTKEIGGVDCWELTQDEVDRMIGLLDEGTEYWDMCDYATDGAAPQDMWLGNQSEWAGFLLASWEQQ